ncbi:hypothetical protein ACOSP7_022251 [Xanthoceras sorbifolium]
MKNSSFGNLVFKDKKRLTWSERKRIAKGLQHLHYEYETRIIHCDFKPHNIHMDESWTPKITDFRLSKLLKPDQARNTQHQEVHEEAAQLLNGTRITPQSQ